MNEKNNKNEMGYYIALCTGMGVAFGVIFNHLSIGICLGVSLGLILDNNKKNK